MNKLFETHGLCSWIALTTPNKARSIEFYSALLGWRIEDMPMPNGSTYSMIKVGEEGIGGIVENAKATAGSGGWGFYITVDSVDDVLARVESLGGRVLSPAFDAPGVGRMAEIADPDGGRFSVITYESKAD